MKRMLISFCVVALLFTGCEEKEQQPSNGDDPQAPTVLSLADANATSETKALYSQLWAIQGKAWMFGHHDDLMYGRNWYGVDGGSDTKDVCGDYPAVYSLDFAQIMDDRRESSAESNALRRKCIIQAYDRGMVVTACAHLSNPLTGKDSWDNSSKDVVKQILEDGSEVNRKFTGWLDNLSEFANGLKGSNGKTIPVIFRPFHEHTQTWSWWGKSCTTEAEFVALWQFTVSYLRDKKGVHNFIYAISPQMDSAKQSEDFIFRWPGDEWVDFIGMDCYQGINNSVFLNNLKVMQKVSQAKKKPCGVTETGVEGFKVKDYWITNIAAPMAGRKVSLLVTWRNKYDPEGSGNHYFSVFPGHISTDSFVAMYNRKDTAFCRDLPDMYSPAENVTVK